MPGGWEDVKLGTFFIIKALFEFIESSIVIGIYLHLGKQAMNNKKKKIPVIDTY